MILVLSDFDMAVSGYQRICASLCQELSKTKEVYVLGLNYGGTEHNYSFGVHPLLSISHVHEIIGLMLDDGIEIEALVVAMDLSLQIPIMESVNIPNKYFPYIGLFPVESPPILSAWAAKISQMDAVLVMSEFGAKALEDDNGIPATFLPIGVDNNGVWVPPSPEHREAIRSGLGIDPDTFVVLTVADNQERKNLSATAEIFSDMSVSVDSRSRSGMAMTVSPKRKTAWYVVTRPTSPVGWDFNDLLPRLGILDRVSIYNRGIPDKLLWNLYAVADVFLLTSKAEGLALPVLEAMAVGLPVVVTDSTAMAEHVGDGERGYLIEADYHYIDPFGNGTRQLVSRTKGSELLSDLANRVSQGGDIGHEIRDRAIEYVAKRTYRNAAEITEAAINKAI